MKRMLFNATYAEELRVATVDGQRLINFDIETSSKEQRRGNIYKGVVTRVEPSLEACFVDYGTEKQGFLPFKEIDFRYLPEVNGQRGRDFTKLPEGTELIVQVEKDERGNKGAALTSYITLPGRYLVLMPNNSRAGGISRRIEGDDRDELKSLMSQLEVPQGMSVILRTAALGRVVEELQWDLSYLLKLWNAIKTAATEQKGSFLIYQESSLVIRSIRDHFSPDITEVLIDTEEVYNQARQFMAHVMPNYAERIKFYRDDVPLFSRFQIEHQIESVYSRAVHLPSGGSIVIDHTEALTAVDVNSAKANKGADIETTALLTNLEAAEEVARQLRLRDLGGLVVVDFIDMENPRNQRDLENHFKLQLGLDRARIQMGKLSKFGLLELSRQRLQSSLDESSSIACPRCAGVGTIRGIESSSLHILRIIQEEAVKNGNHLSALHVQLPVDVATYLLNERRDDVAKIEARMKVKIVLIPNVHLNSPHYRIKKLSHDGYDSNFNKSSYNLVEVPEEAPSYKAASTRLDANTSKQPVVQGIQQTLPAPVIEPRKSKSLFGDLVKKIGELFAAKPEAAKTTANKTQRNRPSTSTQKNNNYRQRDGARGEKNSNTQREPRTEQITIDGQKVRPVAVNKSNDKIQTVRPSQPNAFVKAENKMEISIKPERNTEKTARPEKTERSRNNQRNNTKQNNIERKEVVAQSAYSPKPSASQPLKAKFVPEEGLNIANKTASPQTIFAASASGAVVATVIAAPIIADVKENKDTIKIEINSEPIKVEQPVYTPEPVELGSLELVSTKEELLTAEAPQIAEIKVTRFSDIVIEEKVVDPNIVYQQVETRSS